ncbi:MAG: hypothetical protein B0D92_04290 [Spirochaeta sp. LUC14_002_19_P3]|nr:MAG: hypothetical protein B0D92_04290 [Spirochaeta sp. LUC14_002_19_P3]
MVENVIIMAGGAGKRLWPASLGARPKQFMKVGGNRSLFRLTLKRAFALGMKGTVCVVTHEDCTAAMLDECRDMEKNLRERIVILAEPMARNTAPALALAAAWMGLDGKRQETSLVMAADHLISPIESFSASVEAASIEARKGFIVPYGIVPTHPASGYGYIEVGNAVGSGFEVLSFREKPDEQTAKKYFDSGRYFWNAGLFTYVNTVFMEELRICSPEVAAAFETPEHAWFKRREESGILLLEPTQELRTRYQNCPSLSVDYTVMEKTSRIQMVKAQFQWNDVGSWDVIADLNISPNAPVYTCESNGNFVYADRPVALCGVENLIVVSANDRILICRRGKSQLVRDAAGKDEMGTD